MKPEKTEETKQVSVGRMLINAAKNRALISIIAAAILMLLAQLTMQSMANYVYPNFYGNAKAASAATMVMMVAMFLAAALAKPISNKIGKAELSVISSLVAVVICIVLFIMRPENVWVYVAMITICYLGLGMFNMVVWALITDVIDYSEIVNGVREDGSVYGGNTETSLAKTM